MPTTEEKLAAADRLIAENIAVNNLLNPPKIKKMEVIEIPFKGESQLPVGGGVVQALNRARGSIIP